MRGKEDDTRLVEPRFGRESQERPKRDREYWWNWLNASERSLRVATYEDAIAVVGDSQEFSVQLTNTAMASRLAFLEARRLGVTQLIDTPFNEWSNTIQDDVIRKIKDLQLVDKLKAQNWTLRQLCIAFIDSVSLRFGFESRYWMPRLESETEMIERSIAIGSFLLKQVMEQRGWEKRIDGLIVTSAVLPEDVSLQIVEFAREKSILARRPKVELRDIRLACSGAPVALLMASEDPDLQRKERIVTLSLDALGDMMGLEQFENVWSLEQDMLPRFGNGFVGRTLDPSQVTLVSGSKGRFEPDTSRFTHYYKMVPNDPTIAAKFSNWLEDPRQIIHFVSLRPGHQALLLDLPPTIDHGLPVEGDEPFNYARLIVEMFPDVVSQLQQQLGEDLTESVIITNNAALGMNQLVRRKIARLLGLPNDNYSVLFDKERANSSTGYDALLHKDAQNAWQKMGDKKILIAASTGIGASLILFAFLLKKKNG